MQKIINFALINVLFFFLFQSNASIVQDGGTATETAPQLPPQMQMAIFGVVAATTDVDVAVVATVGATKLQTYH